MGIALILLAVAADSDSSASGWKTIETENFIVYQWREAAEAGTVARRCEQLRDELQRKWLSPAIPAAWNPRCAVVLHPSDESYLREVGEGGRQTGGASFIERRGNRIAARRLDLRAGRFETALAHEMTHVVLADRFAGSRPPPWADEGAAVLADCPEKRRLHERDLLAAMRAGISFRVDALLALDCCPGGQACATFYGQSASLTSFLVARQCPERFVDFVEHSMNVGHDRALWQTYGIDGAAELERLWHAHLAEASRTNRGLVASNLIKPMRSTEPAID